MKKYLYQFQTGPETPNDDKWAFVVIVFICLFLFLKEVVRQ